MTFRHRILRLKQCLNLATDKDVAESLGMSRTALAERKRRDSFPEDALRDLARRRPELHIDVDWVLTGRTRAQIQAAVAGLPARLRELRAERSVKEMADLLDVPAETWRGAENGQVGPELPKRIIQRMDVDPMWLLAGEPQKIDGELSHVEVVLIQNYRNSSDEGRALLRQMAVACANYNRESGQAVGADE